MDQTVDAVAWTRVRERPAQRFDAVSIVLHWLTALLVVGQFGLALLVQRLPEVAASMLAGHRFFGVMTWMVVVGRLVWRRTAARLPPFPPSMSKPQQAAATANEYALYALLLLQPLTGLGDTLFRGHAFRLGLWTFPALPTPDKPVFHALHAAHEWGAWALLALIGLHLAATLLHALVRRDEVLQRMLP
ncbi:MAG: cytochrome [Caulobacteraceae bacterium]|nr:cytochrome [Caulobacteraceae bacterium]